MVKPVPHVYEVEFRWAKRMARVVVLIIMAVPVWYYGPLLFKDGSFGGRWEYLVEKEVEPTVCVGVPYLLQICEVKFSDRITRRAGKLEYLLTYSDFNHKAPDIVRGSPGHYSSSGAVTVKGILERLGAFFVILIALLILEKLYLAWYWRALLNRPSLLVPEPEQSREATSLSRDRRDHF